jgi:arylsulfatase
MLPLFRDPSLPKYAIHDEIFWAFNQTGKGMVKGDWKISSISDGPWRLYNIADDPAEAQNLAAVMPEMRDSMSRSWFEFAEQRTAMDASWRRPLNDYQEGWGFHRIRMAMPDYLRAEPAQSATDVALDSDLSFYFSKPVSFKGTQGRRIKLLAADEPDKVIWQSDPEPGHPSEGKNSVTFDDLPELKPDTTYFVLADGGWIKIGGKPAGVLNDGAYWYRFRTGAM